MKLEIILLIIGGIIMTGCTGTTIIEKNTVNNITTINNITGGGSNVTATQIQALGFRNETYNNATYATSKYYVYTAMIQFATDDGDSGAVTVNNVYENTLPNTISYIPAAGDGIYWFALNGTCAQNGGEAKLYATIQNYYPLESAFVLPYFGWWQDMTVPDRCALQMEWVVGIGGGQGQLPPDTNPKAYIEVRRYK